MSKKAGSRMFALAKMSLSVAGDIASHKAKAFLVGRSDPASDARLNQRVGAAIASTLSEMKGPLMKVGQVFAQLKDVLPVEVSEALGHLRQHARPIDVGIIRSQIAAELGKPPEELFSYFEETAYRAASLGQVHKARLHSGEAVVIKVQYPDVRRDCESDLRQLRLLFKLLPVMGIDAKSLQLVYQEIEAMIRRELSYKAELDQMQAFYDFFADYEYVVVPRPFAQLSTDSVITMTYEKGESLESLQQIRAQGRGDSLLVETLSRNLFTCLVDQIFNLQRIHVDPHAGNFAVKPDGTLLMFDFGAVKNLSPEIVKSFRYLVQAILAEDVGAIEALLFERGIRRPGTEPLGMEFYRPWFDILNKPFLSKTYNFEDSHIHVDAIGLVKQQWKTHQHYFFPSQDTLLLDRLIVGHYWNFVHLKSHFSLRDVLERYLDFPE